jgi:hypothetical protein
VYRSSKPFIDKADSLITSSRSIRESEIQNILELVAKMYSPDFLFSSSEGKKEMDCHCKRKYGIIRGWMSEILLTIKKILILQKKFVNYVRGKIEKFT